MIDGNNGLIHVFVLAECDFDVATFDAVPAQLELAIGAPERGNPFLSGRIYLLGRDFAGETFGLMTPFKGTTTNHKDFFASSFVLQADGDLLVGATRDEGVNATLGAVYHFDGLVEFPHSYCDAGSTTNGCKALLCATGQASASSGSGFVSRDVLRPPAIETYDMKGDLNRTLLFLNGLIDLNDPGCVFDPMAVGLEGGGLLEGEHWH